MFRRIIQSFLLALHNIRSHFFHTILSILGIVIGVAALVIILSLIDGLEVLARRQLSTTTSIKSIVVQSEPVKTINQVRVRKDTFAVISYPLFKKLDSLFSSKGTFYLRSSFSREISFVSIDTTAGSNIFAVSPSAMSRLKLRSGRLLNEDDFKSKAEAALINKSLAGSVIADSLKWDQLVGDTLMFSNRKILIVGIVNVPANMPEVFLPITLLSRQDLQAYPPQCIIDAREVEQVAGLRDDLVKELSNYSIDKSDFSVVTNEFWVEQVTKGFLLFRVVMGLIVGISVVVGGIGVMNVLLISVTERTVEIGIRKAVGANRRDIVMQFLAESITVSVFGSGLGLLIGFLTTLAFVPLVKLIVNVPFEAAYTWNTFLVVSSISILIGIIFGTYPALRASRLDPVEAIRRE